MRGERKRWTQMHRQVKGNDYVDKHTYTLIWKKNWMQTRKAKVICNKRRCWATFTFELSFSWFCCTIASVMCDQNSVESRRKWNPEQKQKLENGLNQQKEQTRIENARKEMPEVNDKRNWIDFGVEHADLEFEQATNNLICRPLCEPFLGTSGRESH